MTPYEIPLRLLQQLSLGSSLLENTLLERLQVTPVELQQALLTLQAWGVVVTTDVNHHYRVVVPPPRLSHAALCHASQHRGITLMPVLSSTNQYLLDHHRSLQLGDACVAEYQTAGRGRRGRPWHATFGSCALFSMFWYWPQFPHALVGLSLALSLVTAETLRGLGAETVKVKWPNDLYMGERKLGGVLIEMVAPAPGKAGISVIMGCGINLLTPASSLPIDQPMVSLQAAGVAITGEQLIGQILIAWRTALAQFAQQGLSPFLARWPIFDVLLGQRVQFQTPRGLSMTGIVRGVDQQGALLLEHQGQLHCFMQGDLRAIYDFQSSHKLH